MAVHGEEGLTLVEQLQGFLDFAVFAGSTSAFRAQYS